MVIFQGDKTAKVFNPSTFLSELGNRGFIADDYVTYLFFISLEDPINVTLFQCTVPYNALLSCDVPEGKFVEESDTASGYPLCLVRSIDIMWCLLLKSLDSSVAVPLSKRIRV